MISSHQPSGSSVVSDLFTDVGVAASESFGPVAASSGLPPADPSAAEDDAGPVAAETVVELVGGEESSV